MVNSAVLENNDTFPKAFCLFFPPDHGSKLLSLIFGGQEARVEK